MVGKEEGGEEARESTLPREHVSMATVTLISIPALQVDLESPAAAVLDTQACLKAVLPERPNPRCHQALLTGMRGRWSGCSHVTCGGLQRGSGGSWGTNHNRGGKHEHVIFAQLICKWPGYEKAKKERECHYLEMCHVCIWCIYLNYWIDRSQIAW